MRGYKNRSTDKKLGTRYLNLPRPHYRTLRLDTRLGRDYTIRHCVSGVFPSLEVLGRGLVRWVEGLFGGGTCRDSGERRGPTTRLDSSRGHTTEDPRRSSSTLLYPEVPGTRGPPRGRTRGPHSEDGHYSGGHGTPSPVYRPSFLYEGTGVGFYGSRVLIYGLYESKGEKPNARSKTDMCGSGG